MIRALLGIDWLARKLGYVEQDVRTARRDLEALKADVRSMQRDLHELEELARPKRIPEAALREKQRYEREREMKLAQELQEKLAREDARIAARRQSPGASAAIDAYEAGGFLDAEQANRLRNYVAKASAAEMRENEKLAEMDRKDGCVYGDPACNLEKHRVRS